MALITMHDVCWGFGDPPLLENINFTLEKGERVCLLGRNGVGKSTLLKLVSGRMVPDSGDIWCSQGVTISWLTQGVPEDADGTIFEIVAEGFGETGRALVEYHRLCRDTDTPDQREQQKRGELQHLLDVKEGWTIFQSVETVLSRTGLDPTVLFGGLSAGMKRRTLFARALAQSPDILLLDEPTNHLDIDTILWMQDYIQRHVKTLLFVTHDRSFVSKIANRIMELDRGRLFSYPGNYDTYLKRREADLLSEEKQNTLFDKKLSQEERWIRQGIKARRTRNEGRVRALVKIREAYKSRRKKTGNVRLQLQEAERSGKLVIRAKGVGFSYNSEPLVDDFSFILMRGDKVGIIGPNGAGKTTLLNILLKNISPDTGEVRHGTHIEVAYFDQLRAQLDENKTLVENISEDNDYIVFNGRKRHVISHLKDFLFTPERCRTPVYVLSGGEKNRLLLAKLVTQPANVLVLDEPTNDLDIETLELLEELFLEYQGTVLLVSHDRSFLNNVVTSSLVFEGKGRVIEYAGGYDDWIAQRPKPEERKNATGKNITTPKRKGGSDKPKKLGYNEQRELETLPKRIESLEDEHRKLSDTMSDPLFYKKDKLELTRVKDRFNELTVEIDGAYKRWEELEERFQ
ncbi:MAG: ATP-binding cassette domain-containing protein [Desulfobacteraceae bacterium]|nr:ATP-binding cassette domain-containing protein [Desulfobacteraceae bacterium]